MLNNIPGSVSTTDDQINRQPGNRVGELSCKPTRIGSSNEGLFHVGFFVALMSQLLETIVPRYRKTPIMPSSTSEIRVADSHRIDAAEEFAPAMHSAAAVTDEAIPEIIIPVLEMNRLPAQDDMTRVEQTSLLNVGVFASDHVFVRENPW